MREVQSGYVHINHVVRVHTHGLGQEREGVQLVSGGSVLGRDRVPVAGLQPWGNV